LHDKNGERRRKRPLVNFTTFGKKIQNLTKYQLLVVTNISEDEHFGLGEFYKMPE
jgi:hypothetical protein